MPISEETPTYGMDAPITTPDGASLVARMGEKRAREARDAEAIEELWAKTERRDQERRQRENAAAWHSYHLLLAGNHAALCDRHRAKAAELAGELGW